ncbi:MAG: trehalose-phosphatase [Frankiales bacterium]|nr:trehalose-phosphatase [Frankiales bacterium]
MLADLRSRLADAVLALDYDGTLAPIVDRPSEAVPALGAVEVLQALAPRVRALALVTGRPADVVVQLAGLQSVPGLVVLGQYGAQRWSGGTLTSPDELPAVATARAALPQVLAAEGAELEDKGLSLVVHTRRCADPTGALQRLEAPVTAAAGGLEVHRGRLVLELRPAGYDKRAALLSLCEPLPAAVLFAGDDLGDLAAYDAVDELRAAGVVGVTVCSGSDEGPAELRARADVVVDGPAGVVDLLSTLL